MKIKNQSGIKKERQEEKRVFLKKGEGTRNGREVDRVTSLGEC